MEILGAATMGPRVRESVDTVVHSQIVLEALLDVVGRHERDENLLISEFLRPPNG